MLSDEHCPYHHWLEDFLDGTKGKDMNSSKATQSTYRTLRTQISLHAPNPFLLCHPLNTELHSLTHKPQLVLLSPGICCWSRGSFFPGGWSRDGWYQAFDWKLCLEVLKHLCSTRKCPYETNRCEQQIMLNTFSLHWGNVPCPPWTFCFFLTHPNHSHSSRAL